MLLQSETKIDPDLRLLWSGWGVRCPEKIAMTNLCSQNGMFASVHLIRHACKHEESISVLEKIKCITVRLAEKKSRFEPK